MKEMFSRYEFILLIVNINTLANGYVCGSGYCDYDQYCCFYNLTCCYLSSFYLWISKKINKWIEVISIIKIQFSVVGVLSICIYIYIKNENFKNQIHHVDENLQSVYSTTSHRFCNEDLMLTQMDCQFSIRNLNENDECNLPTYDEAMEKINSYPANLFHPRTSSNS